MKAMDDVVIEKLSNRAAGLRALADLRMIVFRNWPYLYEGDEAYEENYIREFLNSERATLILARVDDVPVGMATASPLAGQPDSLVAPLADAGIDVAAAFYFGESVLLPQYRGLGIGHRFFDEREAAARDAGATIALFCAVVREPGDPRRPAGARDLIPFWQTRGYAALDGVFCHMDWKDVGEDAATPHLMQFWAKSL